MKRLDPDSTGAFTKRERYLDTVINSLLERASVATPEHADTVARMAVRIVDSSIKAANGELPPPVPKPEPAGGEVSLQKSGHDPFK